MREQEGSDWRNAIHALEPPIAVNIVLHSLLVFVITAICLLEASVSIVKGIGEVRNGKGRDAAPVHSQRSICTWPCPCERATNRVM